ncbi:MAG: GNAT family N-acetyltransferase, partial [Myxococcota bacterium]|nr:GNAT family N-acetyltransferase [Myxococcota bacterium]
MRIGALGRAELGAARAVLAQACVFDRAAEVAAEKLFEAGPAGAARAVGAWEDERLVGVAAVSSRWVRVIGVVPEARGRGAGTALLAACEAAARDAGEATLRALDQPGNYLAPGIDERNGVTIGWLERRGWERRGEPRVNVAIDVRSNPRVTAERAG